MTRQELRAQGQATLKELFGSDEQTRGLANLLTEAVYGGVWNRPGLARTDRMLCTIAALATVPRLKALRRHLASGLDLGLSSEAPWHGAHGRTARRSGPSRLRRAG